MISGFNSNNSSHIKLVVEMLKKDFLKNLGIVVSGTVLAQLMTIMATPILTRQYEVEDFGMLGVLMAVVGVLSTLVTGRYSLAVMLPKEQKLAANIVILASLVALIFSLLLSLLTPLAKPIASLLGSPELSLYILIVPIVVLMSGIIQTLEDWISRNKRFKLISISIISAAIIGNGVKLVWGYYWPSELGLIAGNIIAVVLPVFFYVSLEYKNIRALTLGAVSFETLKRIAREYSYLPKFRAPKDAINSLSQNAPTFLIALLFSQSQVGLYLLADRMLRLPGVLVGKAVRKVFYQKAAEINNEHGDLFSAVLKATVGLSAVGFVPFLLVVVVGPELFSFVFGNEWREAGEFARWVAIWMFFAFINVPSVVVIPILKLEKQFFTYEIVSIILRLSSFLIGGYFLHDVILAVLLFSIAGAVLNIVLITMILVALKKKDGERYGL